jgi:hypothetical protein
VGVLVGESENKSTKRRTVDDNDCQKRRGRRDAKKPKTVQSVSQLLRDVAPERKFMNEIN